MKPPLKPWNLSTDLTPRPGTFNMAVDEHLFRQTGRDSRTFVRFYRWERPTVSLGYSQRVDAVVDVDSCRRHGVDIVRRITGGKLVLHWREITYAVASSDTEIFSDSLQESYRRISSGLILGLEKMGLRARLAGPPPSSYSKGNMPCFAYPARDEIELDGRKIVGSAQKRIGGRFLQHGSIPLRGDDGLLDRISLCRQAAPGLQMISLCEALGREIDAQWAVERLRDGLAEYFQVRFEPLVLGRNDEDAVRRVQEKRYADEAWTMGRSEAAGIDFIDFG
ncbi:MAG: lipoate--protein ligase family protein [Candidatus Aminicenantes bacterium]|nr:lipoate--protein ligase family protein [Candidatus Aminicenantes bacterium]